MAFGAVTANSIQGSDNLTYTDGAALVLNGPMAALSLHDQASRGPVWSLFATGSSFFFDAGMTQAASLTSGGSFIIPENLEANGAFLQASTTSGATFNLPEGAQPTTPNDGDIWMTTLGLFYQYENNIVGPLTAGGGGTIGGSITAQQIAYGDVTANDITGTSGFTYNPGTSTATLPALVTTAGSLLFASDSVAVNIGNIGTFGVFLNLFTDTGAPAFTIQAVQANVGDILLQLNPAGGNVTLGAVSSAITAAGTLTVDGAFATLAGSHLFASDAVAVNIGNLGFDGFFLNLATDSTAGGFSIRSIQANVGDVPLFLNPVTADVVIGSSAIPTANGAGFLFIPSTTGTPTGTPAVHGATVPIVYDTAASILYAYNGGWEIVGGSGALTPPVAITGNGDLIILGAPFVGATPLSAGIAFQVDSTDIFALNIDSDSGQYQYLALRDVPGTQDLMRLRGGGGIGVAETHGGNLVEFLATVVTVDSIVSTSQINALFVGSPTINASMSSSLTYSVTVAIEGPQAAGTNVTITDATAGLQVGGSLVMGGVSALLTTATNGFPYLPSCAGTPTGVPEDWPGAIPVVLDSVADKLWAYLGGAWKGVVLI